MQQPMRHPGLTRRPVSTDPDIDGLMPGHSPFHQRGTISQTSETWCSISASLEVQLANKRCLAKSESSRKALFMENITLVDVLDQDLYHSKDMGILTTPGLVKHAVRIVEARIKDLRIEWPNSGLVLEWSSSSRSRCMICTAAVLTNTTLALKPKSDSGRAFRVHPWCGYVLWRTSRSSREPDASFTAAVLDTGATTPAQTSSSAS